MRPEHDDLHDEVDLAITDAILALYDAGASRTQAEQALRERIEIMFDVLDEFEEAGRPDPVPWFVPGPKSIH